MANLATNKGNIRCGNSATTAAYVKGINYAISKFSQLRATLYLDAAHGGWIGWGNNLQLLVSTITSSLGSNIFKLRGFTLNKANYQPLGQLCPFQTTNGFQNTYCTVAQNKGQPCCNDPCNFIGSGNVANNELNYAMMLYHAFTNAVPGFTPHFVIDTSRNGVPNSRSNCGEWCNIRNARLGIQPTAATAAPSLIDAYYWWKAPGEDDGCTQILPDGSTCNRYDSNCGSADSIGSLPGEPRAPQAGQWFDYEVKLLVSDPATH